MHHYLLFSDKIFHSFIVDDFRQIDKDCYAIIWMNYHFIIVASMDHQICPSLNI